jgi:two-component system heavy metal sensor histidine kinase CusS
VITVADNGDGIALDVERRLFKRYMHEGDAALTTGTIGLGLAVAKVLATGMGGDIRYERDDGWTRFVLDLPVPTTTPADRWETEARPVEVV